MPVSLTDQEIADLLREPKPLPDDYLAQIQLRAKRGHRERELEIRGGGGSEFMVILRQSSFNPLDFSIILGYRMPNSTQVFRLRRYNGKSHEHTNAVEGESFFAFHIHEATERYQERGLREDAYAIPTDRFGDLHGAMQCLLADCSFIAPEERQGRLFEEG